jgi:hypothetical protein
MFQNLALCELLALVARCIGLYVRLSKTCRGNAVVAAHDI